jgi:uncharacterized protein (DUF58 family)
VDNPRLQITKRAVALIALLVALLILWLITLDYFLLGILFNGLIFIIISYAYTALSLRGLEVKRYSRGAIRSVGDIFEDRIEVFNGSKWPKYKLELIDASEIFTRINSRVINWIQGNEIASYTSHSVINKRGSFLLGPIILKSGDPFGFFTNIEYFDINKRLVVYPYFSNLSKFPLNPGRSNVGAQLHFQTPHTTPQAATVREFVPGDPLNRVHWPLTIKKQKLIVKEFDEDTQSSVWIFLDAKKGSYVHTRDEVPPAYDRNLIPLGQKRKFTLPKDSFEYAVSAAASIGAYCLRNNLPIGLAAESSKSNIQPADKGRRQMGKIMKLLSSIKDDGNTPIDMVIQKQIRNIGRGSSIVIITPVLSESMKRILHHMHKKDLKPIIFLIDNESFNQKSGEFNQRTIESYFPIRYGFDLLKSLEGSLI